MKEASMAGMFNRIAPRYDFLNRMLSFRRDVYWRKQVVRQLPKGPDLVVIDIATGTGDLAIAMCQQAPNVAKVYGIDVSDAMMAYGHYKMEDLGLLPKIELRGCSASDLLFDDATFDAATVAFGVRNFSDLDLSLKEMARVLKPGGRALVLEFSMPKNPIVRFFYLLYFRHLLPIIGGWLSKDADAYQYLNTSVESFETNESFKKRMSDSGFDVVMEKPMTLGVVTIYVADKR